MDALLDFVQGHRPLFDVVHAASSIINVLGWLVSFLVLLFAWRSGRITRFQAFGVQFSLAQEAVVAASRAPRSLEPNETAARQPGQPSHSHASDIRSLRAIVNRAFIPEVADRLTSARIAGDYLVREITTANKTLVMTERVLSKDGAVAVLEVSFKVGNKADTYRVRVEETAAGEQTTDVTKVVAGAEHAFGVPAYEALLQKTVPAVQSNDGMLDAEPVVVDVAGKQVAATHTEYKVMIGGKPATMSVIENKAFGDMGGEIATADGKVVYRARILEIGSAPVGTASR